MRIWLCIFSYHWHNIKDLCWHPTKLGYFHGWQGNRNTHVWTFTRGLVNPQPAIFKSNLASELGFGQEMFHTILKIVFLKIRIFNPNYYWNHSFWLPSCTGALLKQTNVDKEIHVRSNGVYDWFDKSRFIMLLL